MTAPPEPGVTLYLDAEDSWGNFNSAGRAMATCMGIEWGAGIPLLYFPTHRLLPDLERTLAALVEREGVKYIVADSISRLFPSCIDMDVVNTNWQILERLGCPTMTVAHTPRKDKSSVYGSRAVTGDARLVTCISTPDGEDGLHAQYWSCTKSNGPVGWPGPRGVLYDFSRPGLISRTVTAGKPVDVAAADKNIAAIVDALADGVHLTRAQTALSVPTQLGPKGDMRCRGVLAVIVNLPKCTSHLDIGLGRVDREDGPGQKHSLRLGSQDVDGQLTGERRAGKGACVALKRRRRVIFQFQKP